MAEIGHLGAVRTLVDRDEAAFDERGEDRVEDGLVGGGTGQISHRDLPSRVGPPLAELHQAHEDVADQPLGARVVGLDLAHRAIRDPADRLLHGRRPGPVTRALIRLEGEQPVVQRVPQGDQRLLEEGQQTRLALRLGGQPLDQRLSHNHVAGPGRRPDRLPQTGAGERHHLDGSVDEWPQVAGH